MRKIEEILNIVGGMQHFTSGNDVLTEVIDDMFSDELSIDDLELVSAAANIYAPSFSDFKKLLETRS